ncbi:hypothetical protein HY413_03960 [Candidatus Kaiserbacteria bacterium]|nr:hypothetical protein [Candidatus Kaiserbacteria bacterium]
MDSTTLTALQLGLFGGLGRTVVGSIKVLLNRRHLDMKALVLLLLLNGGSGMVLGGLAGAYLAVNPVIAGFIGYASFDLLDSAHKLVKLSAIKIPTKTVGIMNVKKKSTFEEAMEFR